MSYSGKTSEGNVSSLSPTDNTHSQTFRHLPCSFESEIFTSLSNCFACDYQGVGG